MRIDIDDIHDDFNDPNELDELDKISGSSEGSRSNIREAYLPSSTILRYLVGNDDQLDTMIMCNPGNFWFTTSDQELYNALGSVQGYESPEHRKLVKLLEVVRINPVKKRVVLTPEMVDRIRHDALKD